MDANNNNPSSIMIIIIFLFCTLLYLLLSINLIPIQLTIILSMTIVLGAFIIIGYYSITAFYHPLQQRIFQSLAAYEREQGQCKHFQIILNLSGHPISTSTQFEAFNVRFQDCVVNGFIANQTFHLVISHPNQHLPSITKLWSEIGKCHTKFQDICLAINPEQLEHLEAMLSHEWLSVQNILKSAYSASLLINSDKIAQSMNYVQEYGTLPKPIIINPYYKFISVLQQSNNQLNHWIQQLYKQRHELCIYPPINTQQKTYLFQLSQLLQSLKSDILGIISFSQQSKIPLYTIYFGINNRSLTKESSLEHYKLPVIASILTLMALGLFSGRFLIHSRINTQLSQTEPEMLTPKLYALQNYPQFKSIQKKHLALLKDHYLDKTPQKEVYHYLFSNHQKSNPKLKVDVVNHLTQNKLEPHVAHFLSQYWFTHSDSFKQPILSDIAPIISESNIPIVCQVLEPAKSGQCTETLNKIKTYQTYDQTLQKIEKTLIPIDTNNHEYTLRQLNYLTQNPRHIGQEALHQLDDIIKKLSKDGHQSLINRAKEIQSIVHLLKSSNGQYILHKIKSLHELNHNITSDETALSILQKAYLSDHHPLREIAYIQQNLAPHQAKWLQDMTDPIIKNIAYRANQSLKKIWNDEVCPDLFNLQSKFPFSDKDPLSPHEMYQSFQLVHAFFDQYLRMFVQEENGDIVIKPYNLGINIPEHVLTLYIYTKIINSSLDIKQDHFHSAWAISLKEMPHPIEAIYLHSANKKIPLKLHKGTVLHWDSRYPIGFDVVLKNNETVSIVQNNNWSILTLFSKFKQSKSLSYQYESDDQTWHFTVEAKPQYPINLLDTDLIQNLPFSTWQ